VPLQSLDPVYVNFTVPQQDVAQIRPGAKVSVTFEGMTGAEPVGTITALDSVVDPATRNVQVQATFPNPERRLRPGMFVKAQVMLGRSGPVVSLPASAINYAPYGDSVYVVSEIDGPRGRYRGVNQQFVKLGGSRGDQVAVLSGITPGQEIVSSGGFKLRPKAAVSVHNQVQPANDPAPRPEDN
jgi:membrane fusion protein, multidrug efflux system